MTKARLLAALLSLALALAGTSAVLAQEEEDLGPFEDAEQLGFAQEFYSNYAEAMGEMGITGESLDFSTDWLQAWFGGMEDMDAEMPDEADMSADEAAALEDEMNDDEEAIAEALMEDEEE